MWLKANNTGKVWGDSMNKKNELCRERKTT